MSTRLLPCLLGAAALHAAALGWLAHGPARPGGDGGPVAGAVPAQRAALMQVALRTQAAPPPGPAGEARVAQANGHATEQTSEQIAKQTVQQPAQEPIQQTAARPSTPSAPAGDDATAAPAPAPQAIAGSTLGGPDAQGYVPRPLLSTAPEPTQDIALPFPLDFAGRGRFAGILTLYIEADGRVSRVVVEGASLPPPLARVAQQAFSGTRFTPGRVERRIVKSRIRVEVVFENPSAA
ncbi:MAG: hypothetical protein HZB72_05795 [Burkholderiales bacterium]|nr:hypothetical protein [Burkholderiales bacterium]